MIEGICTIERNMHQSQLWSQSNWSQSSQKSIIQRSNTNILIKLKSTSTTTSKTPQILTLSTQATTSTSPTTLQTSIQHLQQQQQLQHSQSCFSDWPDVLPGDVQTCTGILEHVSLLEAFEQRRSRVLLAAEGPRSQSDRCSFNDDQTGMFFLSLVYFSSPWEFF